MRGFVQTVTRTRIYELTWTCLNFSVYGPAWHRQGTVRCFRCGKAFKDGDEISLSGVKRHVNITLCVPCAEDADPEATRRTEPC